MTSKITKVQEFVGENPEKVDGLTVKEIQQKYIEDNEHVSRGTVSNALRHDDSFADKLHWKLPDWGPKRAEVLDISRSNIGKPAISRH